MPPMVGVLARSFISSLSGVIKFRSISDLPHQPANDAGTLPERQSQTGQGGHDRETRHLRMRKNQYGLSVSVQENNRSISASHYSVVLQAKQVFQAGHHQLKRRGCLTGIIVRPKIGVHYYSHHDK